MRKETSLAACLLAFLLTFAGAFTPPATAQPAAPAAGDSAEVVGELDESFILYQNDRGDTVCRPATPVERERLRAGGETRVIYRGAPMRRRVVDGEELYFVNGPADPSGAALLPSAGLTIVLRGTQQLEENPTAKAAFIAAANRWEAIISTPITVTLDVDYGPKFFGEDYSSTSILGQTGSFALTRPLSDVRSRLINTASSDFDGGHYAQLPNTTIPAEYDSTTIQLSNVRVASSQARAIGYNVSNTNPEARIGFNSGFGFDFNPEDGITPNTTDFDSVVVHEIGHALGFTSSNGGGSATAPPTALSIWDLFRFRPTAAFNGQFGAAPRVMSAGGTQVFFASFTNTFGTNELGVSTGGPAGDAGDRHQSSHWRADETAASRPFIGIMDPTLSRNLRRTMTENDIRALDLLGYTVVFNPTRPANDDFGFDTALAGEAGTAFGTSVWATRQQGEPFLQAAFQGDKSVWFAWQAPTTGTATFDTSGSGYDTTLGVYTGDAFNNLQLVGADNDGLGVLRGPSRVTFNTTAGTLYRVNVDGRNGENGAVQLNWASSGTAPSTTVTVTGRVFEGGQALPGVTVGLYNSAGALLQQTTTGGDGRWTFTGVPVNQSYSVTFAKSGYTFSQPAVIFSLGPTAFDAGVMAAFKVNPIDGTEFFVTQHYRDFLGREPDASGLNHWTNEIEQCGADVACRQARRINVSAAFFLSIEFQNTGYLVERMYKAAYGDAFEASTGLTVPVIRRDEFMADTPLISAGVIVGQGLWQTTLDNNKTAYAQTFVQRPRFLAAFPVSMTAAEFVDRLNQNAGGVLTGDERAALVNEAAANTPAARASVLRQVAENAELDRREKNRAFVLMQYYGYLRRNPNDAPEAGLNFAGWNFWLGKLNEFNGDAVAAEMVKAFLESAEYRNRFAGQ